VPGAGHIAYTQSGYNITIDNVQTAVASDFDVLTAVERELVLRLASLLWRLRRATAIDTGLLQIPGKLDEGSDPAIAQHGNETSVGAVTRIGQFAHQLDDHERDQPDFPFGSVVSKRFMRLDPGAVERLGRYEMTLSRQVYQVIFVLDFLRRQNLDLKWLPRPSSAAGRFRPLRPPFPTGSGQT